MPDTTIRRSVIQMNKKRQDFGIFKFSKKINLLYNKDIFYKETVSVHILQGNGIFVLKR